MKLKKQHAKDYLLEYKRKKDTPNWLGLLIQEAINSSGRISDESKEKIFVELLKDNNIESEKQISEFTDTNDTENQEVAETCSTKTQALTLQKITHAKGVNALISGQEVKFSSSCTIFFGLNGAGKSGYFRIIHELAGGSKAKKILSNIRNENDDLEVDINYSLDDQQFFYKWQDKNERGIAPFKQIRVFDSQYLPFFLDRHESSINIEPLGLNLFQEIITIIDDFKKELEQTKNQKVCQLSNLQTLINVIHSDALKAILQKSLLTEKERQLLDTYKIFSDEDVAKLTDLKQRKNLLEKEDTESNIKVLIQENKEINKLKEYLSGLKTCLDAKTEDSNIKINSYLEKKKAKEKRAKQCELLKNVPFQGTAEWDVFIKSAKIYGAKIDPKTFDKKKRCIYCHQLLGEEAIKLVRAYSEYLEEKSKQEFDSANNEIEQLSKEIENISTEFDFSESLEKLFEETKNEQEETYKILVQRVLEDIRKQKTLLQEALETKKTTKDNFSLDLLNVDKKLDELLEKGRGILDDLQEDREERTKKIVDLELNIFIYEDKQNISNWRNEIENYFTVHKTIQKYSDASQLIKTNGITMQSSKAHNDLLTEAIRTSFEDEMKTLGKNIEVTLEPSGAGKGAVFTKLKILGKDINNILSEGEQKAIGLALFLAEVENQKDNCPIVFDDPVTSLDHEVADTLAKKLLQMSSNRQIIIFTHNKLFYNSLDYWSRNLKDNKDQHTHHICKNYGNGNKCKEGAGHHVYTYRMERESKDRVGKIFEAENESCRYYIARAEKEMGGTCLVSSVAGYLKSAIEYYIDEKVLNNQSLVKDKKKGGYIDWDRLKEIKPDPEIIEKLKEYWDKLSNKGTHLTADSQEIPMSLEELNEVKDYIKSKL